MVNKMQQQVADFHRAMGQPVGHSVRALPQERKAVRIELIREEFIDELIPALGARVTFTPDGIFEGRVKKGPNYFKPNLRELLESGHADIDIAAAPAAH